MSKINLIYYLVAGSIFGALSLKTGIPAAPLAGALIGASILSINGKIDIADWPIGTRTILGAAPGGISGMSLIGSEYGVGASVATLHAVRLITVLIILPLVVRCLNLFGVIKS